jgi:hypothetical protein
VRIAIDANQPVSEILKIIGWGSAQWPPVPASSTLILSKIPLLGDTDVSLASTKVSPSKEQEGLLGDTDVSLASTKVSPSKEETENKRPRRRRGEGSGLTTETKNLPKAF